MCELTQSAIIQTMAFRWVALKCLTWKGTGKLGMPEFRFEYEYSVVSSMIFFPKRIYYIAVWGRI